MAFKLDYIKRFQEGLEPYGFKRLKGTEGFGKLINNEILQLIMLKKYSPPDRGKKAFDIIFGVRTIYGSGLEYGQIENSGIGLCINDPKISNGIYFVYQDTDWLPAINEALKHTISFALPILSNINSLNSCIDFYLKYLALMIYDADSFAGESPLLFLTNNHNTFEELFKQQEGYALQVYKNESTDYAYNCYIEQMSDTINQNIVNARDKVWASPKLQKVLHDEISRRVEMNKEQLKQYGLL